MCIYIHSQGTPILPVFLFLCCPLPTLAQVLYGLDVIGSINLRSKSQRGQGIALVFRH